MGEKKVVDLSRFFLFEAAGDSEADFDSNLVSFGKVDDQGNEYKVNDDGDDDDDDDAESCSYDVGYCDTSHSRNAQVEILEKGHDYDDHTTHDDDDDDEDLDGGMRDDREDNDVRYCIDDDHHHHHGYDDEMVSSEVTSTANSYASRKCARSSKRKMSEIEKSRLFWEACLAS